MIYWKELSHMWQIDNEHVLMNDVIEALKSYMNYTGLSQRNVAEILEVSEATVSRYLSYERRPNSAIYNKLSNLLGIKTIAENDIHTIKNIIERLIKENIEHYTSNEKLHLIGILSQ
jgi:predicted transcriptional regulator